MYIEQPETLAAGIGLTIGGIASHQYITDRYNIPPSELNLLRMGGTVIGAFAGAVIVGPPLLWFYDTILR